MIPLYDRFTGVLEGDPPIVDLDGVVDATAGVEAADAAFEVGVLPAFSEGFQTGSFDRPATDSRRSLDIPSP